MLLIPEPDPDRYCRSTEAGLVGTCSNQLSAACSAPGVGGSGADYDAMLKDALDAIPENTPAKEARLEAMVQAGPSPAYQKQIHWIGRRKG
jgi:hypothetical protein